MTLDVLVFSKDRPLQLDGYIHSLNFFAGGNGVNINISVLIKTTPEYKDAYSIVKNSYTNVTFIEETNFAQQIKEWLSNASPMVMFGCDDVVFKDYIDLNLARKLLTTLDPPIDFVSLRLDKDITYCQPSDKEMIVPALYPIAEGRAYYFDWKSCPMNWDWGYPFEVAASIYRRDTIINLISLFPNNIINHPNKIEGPLCYQAIRTWRGLGSCFSTAKMNTITVNRVQELEKNKLCVKEEVSPSYLLGLFYKGRRIDFERYRDTIYNSICIGDLKLC